MNKEIAINVKNLCKEYILYDKNIDQLKEIFSITHKCYHKVHKALDNINLEVARGEHIGIIGTNGSGKSTLLKILTGVVTPTSGTVEVNGKVSALLELGAGFNPNYTGIENIYLNGTIMGYSRDEMSKKINSIVSFADIGDFINQPVKNYSSGMFARLAFAVAINVEPDILIVDEALSVGDAFFQNKCYRKFDELKKRGITILFVSHDIESIKQMCTRVLWIEHGEQRMLGERNEVCQAFFNMRMRLQNEENTIHYEQMKHNKVSKVQEKDVVKRYPMIQAKLDDIVSEDVQILSSNIRDMEDNIVLALKSDQTYEVEILVKLKRDISQLIVGCTFSDIKGIGYLAYNTYEKNKEFISCTKGEMIRVGFTFKMPQIKRGKYFLDVAVAEGTQEEHIILSWIHGVCEIEVMWEGYELSFFKIPYNTKISIEKNAELY